MAAKRLTKTMKGVAIHLKTEKKVTMTSQSTFLRMQGAMVENRYVLKQLLGVGGFGGVFKSDEVFLDELLRQVAVKVIAPPEVDLGLSPNERETQFKKQQRQQRDELIAAVNLTHPNVIAGFHVGLFNWESDQTDYLYLVMELAEGTLRAKLKEKPNLTEGEVTAILTQVAKGLDYLHREKRQVHRDLKPGNILLSGGNWKLSDFGLVRNLSDKTHTQTGDIVGSLAYMPPEALDGTGSQISVEWDIWSLGILGSVLLQQGQLPYEYQSQMQLRYKIQEGEVILPSTMPEHLGTLIKGCLIKERKDRWNTLQVIEYLNGKTTPVIIATTTQACFPNLAKLHCPDYKFPPKTKQQGLIPGLSGTQSMISPDCRYFVTYGNGLVKVWDIATGVLLHIFQRYSFDISEVIISPDGKTFVLVGRQEIRVWNLTTGNVRFIIQNYSLSIKAAAISYDGKTLFSINCDKTINTWNLTTGELLDTDSNYFEYSNHEIVISPNGQTFVCASNDEDTVYIWNLITGDLLHTFSVSNIFSDSIYVHKLAMSPDGKTIITIHRDEAKVWDLNKTGFLGILKFHFTIKILRLSKRHVISPDGKILFCVCSDDTIDVWNLISKKLLYNLGSDSKNFDFNSLAMSPDGKIFVSRSSDNTIKVKNLATGTLLCTLNLHSGSVNAVAISTDGKTLVSGSGDNTINVWDIITGELLRTLQGHSSSVNTVAISPDGKTLVSGSDDNTIKVWDIITGNLLHTLQGHSGYVNTVAINPDGKTLVSGSDDNTIKVWDIITGNLLHTLQGHSSRVNAVAINPDGKTFISGSTDTDIRVWPNNYS